MSDPNSSSNKVPYDLRPRKQIERLMMVHVLQNLAESGFSISTYRYAGFGAFFFIDFILFRRLLSIDDMVSIEHDINCQNRVKFNLPFKNIKLQFQGSSDFISEMNRDKPHIIWFDYDGPVEANKLNDLESATSKLSPGSILITTIDVDFDKADKGIRDIQPEKKGQAWFDLFKKECGMFFNPTWNPEDFKASEIHKRTLKVIESAILSGINMRDEIHFEPLFNFLYADGHEMLTFGGIICTEEQQRKLRRINWSDFNFIRRSLSSEPYRIDIPILTRKERLLLDSNMPCEEDWVPSEFEIDIEAIQNYREVFRYCPLYAELLV